MFRQFVRSELTLFCCSASDGSREPPGGSLPLESVPAEGALPAVSLPTDVSSGCSGLAGGKDAPPTEGGQVLQVKLLSQFSYHRETRLKNQNGIAKSARASLLVSP